VDRIFSTGDLIDRGVENEECLRLLHNDWFNATIGNHEFFVILFFHRLCDEDMWFYNGGNWAANYAHAIRAKTFDPKYNFLQDASEFWWELFPQIKKMPMMMSVRLRDWKKFHVVHAELNPFDFVLTDKNLLSEKFVRTAWTNESGFYDSEEVRGDCDGMWNVFLLRWPFRGRSISSTPMKRRLNWFHAYLLDRGWRFLLVIKNPKRTTLR
jgi:hypothetical protein